MHYNISISCPLSKFVTPGRADLGRAGDGYNIDYGLQSLRSYRVSNNDLPFLRGSG